MKYLVQNSSPNRQQRNSALPFKKSGKKPGPMQNKAIRRAEVVYRGRNKINFLFLRAGIALNL